jgi:hypothetical protein
MDETTKKMQQSRWAYFRGYICTCNADGAIPLNAMVVMDLSAIAGSKTENEALRVIAAHNDLLDHLAH